MANKNFKQIDNMKAAERLIENADDTLNNSCAIV
jgi:hypothetical protein